MTVEWLAACMVAVAGLALRPAPPARRGDAVGPVAAPERPVVHRPRRTRLGMAADPLVMAAWCDALARAVRGGSTIRHAITAVEPPPAAAGALEPVRHALDRGSSLADALTAALDGPRNPAHRGAVHLDLVLVVLRACAEHGGAAAEPIDRCAAALRQRAALVAERRSQSAQARLSAAMMTLLPVALLAVLLLTSAPVRRAVLTLPGAAALLVGGTCNVAGWAWMRRTISGGGRWR